MHVVRRWRFNRMAVCGYSVRADWRVVDVDGERVEDGESDRFTGSGVILFVHFVRYILLRWFLERNTQNGMDEFVSEHREIQRSRFRRLRAVMDGELVVLFAEFSVAFQRRVSVGVCGADSGLVFARVSTYFRGEAEENKGFFYE